MFQDAVSLKKQERTPSSGGLRVTGICVIEGLDTSVKVLGSSPHSNEHLRRRGKVPACLRMGSLEYLPPKQEAPCPGRG